MKKVTLTCPFTGIDFDALEDADGNIIAMHALTGEELRMNWNNAIKKYNIPSKWFKQIETVSISQAAELLNVSIARASRLCAKGQIRTRELANGQKIVLLDSLIKYRKNRKNGRPKSVD